jgi:hypothetical protein
MRLHSLAYAGMRMLIKQAYGPLSPTNFPTGDTGSDILARVREAELTQGPLESMKSALGGAQRDLRDPRILSRLRRAGILGGVGTAAVGLPYMAGMFNAKQPKKLPTQMPAQVPAQPGGVRPRP